LSWVPSLQAEIAVNDRIWLDENYKPMRVYELDPLDGPGGMASADYVQRRLVASRV